MTAIYGAGWHGKEVLAIIQDCETGFGNPAVFIDDKVRSPVWGIPVLHPGVLTDPDFRSRHAIVVAIGDNLARVAVYKSVIEYGCRTATVIHPSAKVWSRHPISEGTVIFPNAIISVEAKIGRFCIVNKHATVGHGAELGEGVNMADASVCSGKVGDRSFLGFHAAVLPGVNIGQDCTIGAGAVVTKDVPDGETWVGIPARPK